MLIYVSGLLAAPRSGNNQPKSQNNIIKVPDCNVDGTVWGISRKTCCKKCITTNKVLKRVIPAYEHKLVRFQGIPTQCHSFFSEQSTARLPLRVSLGFVVCFVFVYKNLSTHALWLKRTDCGPIIRDSKTLACQSSVKNLATKNIRKPLPQTQRISLENLYSYR